VSQVGRLVLLGVVAGLGLAFGPVYCSMLCPFGAAQELSHGGRSPLGAEGARAWDRWRGPAVWHLLALALADTAGAQVLPDVAGRAPRTGLLFGALVLARLAWQRVARGAPRAAGSSAATEPPSPAWSAVARYAKYLLLALALGAMALGAADRVAATDPLAMAFSRRYGVVAFSLLGLMLVLSSTHFRPFCRHACAVGALTHLTNKGALLRRLAPARRYPSCDLGVRSRFDVDCIQCNRCVGASGAAPPRAGRRGDRALLLALGLLGALLAAHGWSAEAEPSNAQPSATGAVPRDAARDTVESARIRRLVSEGKLSDHEARYYRPADSSAPAPARAPAASASRPAPASTLPAQP
jgi:hypothetical protein